MMNLECKLKILEETNGIEKFYKQKCCIFVKCLDNEIRDTIYNKFGDNEYKNNKYSYKENNDYICNKHLNKTLIIAEKNELKDYILNKIEDKEVSYMPRDNIWVFLYWIKKELNLEIYDSLTTLQITQLDIKNERLKQKQENKQKAMNLINELF